MFSFENYLKQKGAVLIDNEGGYLVFLLDVVGCDFKQLHLSFTIPLESEDYFSELDITYVTDDGEDDLNCYSGLTPTNFQFAEQLLLHLTFSEQL